MNSRSASRLLVVGAGGLLGKSVTAELRRTGTPFVRATVDWSDTDSAVRDLDAALQTVDDGSGVVTVYWCAGAGITSSSREHLDQEVEVFTRFLRELGRRPPGAVRLFLASSVGGVYGGARGLPFTEFTPAAPVSAYGESKLAMERAAEALAGSNSASVLIGRISNLYGPGQNAAKAQGLITVLADAALSSTPVSLYVSLDTIRDYLYADDCARMVVDGMRRLEREPEGTVVTKILATGMGTTISSLIADFRRLTRRKIPFVLTARSAAGQAPDLRVRSVVWNEIDRHARTPLVVGMRAVLDTRLRRMQTPALTTNRGSDPRW